MVYQNYLQINQMMMKIQQIIPSLIIAVGSSWCLSSPAQALTFYFGNGNSGFGGVLGTGNIALQDDGTTIQGTFNKGAGGFNDAIVLYIDSTTGGFANTTNFNDNADNLRKAISATSSRITFPSGFNADYALAFSPIGSVQFGGLWALANGVDNSLIFVDSINLSPNNNTTNSSYTFDFNLSEIGLVPNSGASFNLIGTYVSVTSFRADEAIGDGISSGNPGFSSVTFTGSRNYQTTAVPFTFAPGAIAINMLIFISVLGWRKSIFKQGKKLLFKLKK